jgi:hypothetical protein
MSIQKPQPLRGSNSLRNRCPVCNQATYSTSGIHPQCAAKRASDSIQLAVKAKRTSAVPNPPSRSLWLKQCPKCRRDVSARRAVCDCGHSFLAKRAD